MANLFTKKHTKVGARPGTLMIGKNAVKPSINIIRYTPTDVQSNTVETIEDVSAELEKEGVVWIDVQGLGDEKLLRGLGELFSIHMLALEDVVNTPQRPKTESYDAHQLYISRMVSIGETRDLEMEQVSIFFGKKFFDGFYTFIF